MPFTICYFLLIFICRSFVINKRDFWDIIGVGTIACTPVMNALLATKLVAYFHH